MQEFIIYILQMSACSGILLLYYRIVLYNKGLHQWNRFFLLATVLLSLLIPLLRLPVWDAVYVNQLTESKPLHTILLAGGFHEQEARGHAPVAFLPVIVLLTYLAGCLVMLTGLLRALVRIALLIRRSGRLPADGCTMVFTADDSGPFSFFKYIFWNSYTKYQSEEGACILTHEMVHVRQWHSADNLAMNIIMIACWCNPFFWMIRRELNMVHEFIADEQAIPDRDSAIFSKIILSLSYPHKKFPVTSYFFSSSIKRRLIMLTTSKPKNAFFVKLLTIPVVTGLLATFSFTHRQALTQGAPAPEKISTIVIDAGHGGENAGAVSPGGIQEKDIALAIAKKIQQLNKDQSIRIVLTRSTDVTQTPREKVAETARQKPDAFISLHVNSAEASYSGFDVYLSSRTLTFEKESQALGSALTHEINEIYSVKPALQKQSKGIWVLDQAKTYPAVILECGNMESPKDVAFITNPSNQDQIAQQILKGISEYIHTSSNTK